MDTIELYSFEDADGTEQGFTTRDIREAREFAQKHGYRIIANIFEFSDSEMIEDYAGEEEEEDWEEDEEDTDYLNHEPIPEDFPVQPLKEGESAKSKATCGHCGLSWDDSIPTAWTPAPSARCPFEYFHIYPDTRARKGR